MADNGATHHCKFIFVTGGVVSSLGKGIVAASLAKLLQARGYSVTIQKFDPYINLDPGTLNPYEHGEVYVTEDGAETDLDLGHYERYLNVPTSQANNVTTGRIYETVIRRERKGEYGGKTVQVIPHITDEIKRRIKLLAQTGKYHIVITEIGGTVGDIESLPYIEAVRQLDYELGPNQSLVIHLTLVPFLKASGELKTKPTQHSVKMLLESGVQPDILVCRTEHRLDEDLRAKLALFCNLPPSAVIEAADAETIYEVPLLLQREQLDTVVLQRLQLPEGILPELKAWKEFLRRLKNPLDEVRIGLVGKYVELPDAYKSIQEALVHAGAVHELRVRIEMVHSEDINPENVARILGELDGVLVAPGFGQRGTEGKITAIRYVREQGLPFLGICLGMQMAVVEFGRNVLGYSGCNSTEFEPEAEHPVISLMASQQAVTDLGGTMRLGVYPCSLQEGTRVRQIYGQPQVHERHRHRYEFNNAYREAYTAGGLVLGGINAEQDLVEMIELPGHPFYVACQFHPEYRSTVEAPHPLFVAFVGAVYEERKRRRRVKEPVGEPAVSPSGS
ncbi:MAG: CTP synthase [Bacteroidia bacterium]|nr:CTP synthase [Bacteroidia bacterium]